MLNLHTFIPSYRRTFVPSYLRTFCAFCPFVLFVADSRIPALGSDPPMTAFLRVSALIRELPCRTRYGMILKSTCNYPHEPARSHIEAVP
jgi:hypothetical protein